MRTTYLILAMLFLSTAAWAGIVTFDDLVGQQLVPDGYGGINWGGFWTYYGWVQGPYPAHSLPNRIYAPCCSAAEYQFSFVTPDQVFNGAWFSGYGSVEFRLYNDQALVHTSAVLNPSNVPAFLASGYAGLVDAVGVYSASQQWVMDDVTYAIPEPATLALVGAGLLALGLTRRRR